MTVLATEENLRSSFSRAQSEFGATIVKGLDEMFGDEFAAAQAQAVPLAEEHCKHPIFIYPGKYRYEVNPGKKRKLLGYIGGFPNALATFMRACMGHVLPEYEVARGVEAKNVDSFQDNGDQDVVEQCELIRELLPPKDEEGEVQCIHVDAAVLNPKLISMDIVRTNLKHVLDSKGPVSLFFPFQAGYRLVVFPTAHKPAIECLKNFARHYETARRLFKLRNPGQSEAEWRRSWCGCTVGCLRKQFPGQTFEPVCIPVDVGEMLAISGYLPHCGVPVDGVRGFIAATHKVPCCDYVQFKF
jgi:hypothetical protein